MMEIAAPNGATVVEAGTGRYEYKDRLNADDASAPRRRGQSATACLPVYVHG